MAPCLGPPGCRAVRSMQPGRPAQHLEPDADRPDHRRFRRPLLPGLQPEDPRLLQSRRAAAVRRGATQSAIQPGSGRHAAELDRRRQAGRARLPGRAQQGADRLQRQRPDRAVARHHQFRQAVPDQPALHYRRSDPDREPGAVESAQASQLKDPTLTPMAGLFNAGLSTVGSAVQNFNNPYQVVQPGATGGATSPTPAPAGSDRGRQGSRDLQLTGDGDLCGPITCDSHWPGPRSPPASATWASRTRISSSEPVQCGLGGAAIGGGCGRQSERPGQPPAADGGAEYGRAEAVAAGDTQDAQQTAQNTLNTNMLASSPAAPNSNVQMLSGQTGAGADTAITSDMAGRVTDAAKGGAQGRIAALAGINSYGSGYQGAQGRARRALNTSGEAINMYGDMRKGDVDARRHPADPADPVRARREHRRECGGHAGQLRRQGPRQQPERAQHEEDREEKNSSLLKKNHVRSRDNSWHIYRPSQRQPDHRHPRQHPGRHGDQYGPEDAGRGAGIAHSDHGGGSRQSEAAEHPPRFRSQASTGTYRAANADPTARSGRQVVSTLVGAAVPPPHLRGLRPEPSWEAISSAAWTPSRRLRPAAS